MIRLFNIARNTFSLNPMLDPADRLRAAIVSGNLAICKRLLARFPELWLNTDSSHNGWCNLHYASFHGHYLVCFHLVSEMRRRAKKNDRFSTICDLELVTFDDLTVLHMPLLHQHSQTLHFLLQEFSGKQWLDYKGGSMGRTPLQYCCACRFVDGVKLLLEFGADWSISDKNGDTCLHLCFAYGDLACTEALVTFVLGDAIRRRRRLERGSDTSPRKNGGSNHASRDQLKAILNASLSELESAINCRGQTPLQHAASFDMQHAYAVGKSRWIERVVDEEMALRNTPVPIHTSDLASPGIGSLAHYGGNFASLSRTSFDSDMVDASSPGTDAYNSGSVPSSRPSGRVFQQEQERYKDHDHYHDREPENHSGDGKNHVISVEDPAFKGRKHSRSLPNAAAAAAESDSADLGKSARPHASSFAFNFRGSPLLLTRPTGVASSTFPISPLQVEFTSTQSRKSSFASASAQRPAFPVRSETEDSQIAKNSGSVTPSASSFVNQLTFSPVSAVRRQSYSSTSGSGAGASSDTSPQEPMAATSLARSSANSVLRAKTSGDSLRRNLSTPAKLANAFRAAEQSPAAFLRQSRRPSAGESSSRPSPSKSFVSNYDAGDGSPRGETHTDVEKKFVIAMPPLPPPKPQHQTSLPNLKAKAFSADDEYSSPPRNVRSISFARVREE